VTAIADAKRVRRAPDRVALLVIKAWVEPEAELSRFFARLTAIDELVAAHVEPRIIVSSDVDEICGHVRGWLSDFLAFQETPTPPA
jgi:hypothetical protein